MMKIERHHLLIAGAAAALLAGCNSGDDGMYNDPPPPVTQVPASAGASVEAYTQYVGSLAASETATPLQLDNIPTPPTSETAAPAAVTL